MDRLVQQDQPQSNATQLYSTHPEIKFSPPDKKPHALPGAEIFLASTRAKAYLHPKLGGVLTNRHFPNLSLRLTQKKPIRTCPGIIIHE